MTNGLASSPGFGDDGADRVPVLLPLPLGEPYDYRALPGEAPAPGDVVRVPLGRRELPGVVWEPRAPEPGGAAPVAAERLRDIRGRFDVPPLPAPVRRLVDWVAWYTCAPAGSVLRMAISVPSALEPPRPQRAYRPAPTPPAAGSEPRLTRTRRRVLEVLAEGPPRPAAELAQEAGCSPGVIAEMARAGLLAPVELPATLALPMPDWRRPRARLTGAQHGAADSLVDAVAAGGFTTILLDGVTGSGKTEVYFEAIAATLARGRQVLVLLPEIALSAPWLERFTERFAAPPAEWHSDLTAAARRSVWRGVAEGRVRVLVGARSALFLPFGELGLLIVDEEHEAAFKQEDGVPYHARDMAVVRARLEGCPIVLVSATPSLETLTNAETGRYSRLHLPERHGSAGLPAIEAVDMTAAPPPPGRFLSPPLLASLATTLAAGEQSMLFLNRRGYAPLTLCRACGHRLECPHCTAWLVEHRLVGRLVCHHCGHQVPRPAVCPECGAEASLAACGPGVERIAEEVDQRLPGARWALATSDTLHGPRSAAALMQQVGERAVDIVIGTQLLAKGHHWPMLTLVGVVDADLGLAGGDLRAAERTYQLLHQVAGRAGRAERPGRVLLQTCSPAHPVIDALVRGDRDGFLALEAEARRRRGLPPFGRLAAIVVSGPDSSTADRVAAMLGRTAPNGRHLEVLGPAPAPLAVLRGRHRRRLLLKAARQVPIQEVIGRWLAPLTLPSSVRVTVDVDPYSFL